MPNPKRVLMSADTAGGVFQYALELANGLAKHGTEVLLATMGGPLSSGQLADLAERRQLVRHVHLECKLEWMQDPWRDVDRAGDWLLALGERFEPDIVHINGYAHAALDFQRPVVAVAHSCVFSWWRAVKKTVVPDSFIEYGRRVTLGLAGAETVVAPSVAMVDALAAHYPLSQKPVVVYNGRNPVEFAPSKKQHFVVALGRAWDEAKNVAALDQAARWVPWPILVGGPGARDKNDRVALRAARHLGVLDTFAVRKTLSRAAIFAHPARYEPFGLSVLEAALSGAALVLGDIPSLREIWDDAALYVDPEDPGMLAHTLRRLIARRGLWAEMQRRARERALWYGADSMVTGYLRIYQAHLGRPAAARSTLGATCA